MTTNWPLAKDSYSTKVDNVDDVMASHINNPQDAIEALQDLRNYSLKRVKNTSGSTVAANDVGYLDAAGEFKLTTTAYLDEAWCVVVAGATNNADIIVTTAGLVTVILNGNCSIGDFLYTSTTTKQAQPQSYMRPQMLAIAKTANTSGAGGTCEAQLYCGTKYVGVASTTDILFIVSQDESDWRTTINGAPAGAVVTYTVALTSGAENTIVPSAANQYGKLRMYNETRSNYALVDSVNIGANTFTVTDADDIADWVNTDVITTRSQTVVDPGPPPYFFDVDLSSADNDTIPALARVLSIDAGGRDAGGTGAIIYLHPWETYSVPKIRQVPSYLANQYTFRFVAVPLFQQRFSYEIYASGAAQSTVALRLAGWWVAVP